MDDLFTLIFSSDHLEYVYDEKKNCVVAEDNHPKFIYNHKEWEDIYLLKQLQFTAQQRITPTTRKSFKKDDSRRKQKCKRSLFKPRRRKSNQQSMRFPAPKHSTFISTPSSCPSLPAVTPISPDLPKLPIENKTYFPPPLAHSTPIHKTQPSTSELPVDDCKPLESCSFSSSCPSLPVVTPISPDLPTLSIKNKTYFPPPLAHSTPIHKTQPSTSELPVDDCKPFESCSFSSSCPSLPVVTPISPDLPTLSIKNKTYFPPPLAHSTPIHKMQPSTSELTVDDCKPFESCSSASPGTSNISIVKPTNILSTHPTRGELGKYQLPSIDSSIIPSSVRITMLPSNFDFTDVMSLRTRPPESIVEKASELIRDKVKTQLNKKLIDVECLEKENNSGVLIGNLGVFSRAGIAQLQEFCEIRKIQVHLTDERKWIMDTSDDLPASSKELILTHLNDFNPNHVVNKEGDRSVTVQAMSYLAMERYIDDTVIDFFLSRYQKTSHPSGSVLCLPSHAVTWIETHDEDFIQQCFQEVVKEVDPLILRLIVIPINISNAHWGLIAINIKDNTAFFDDGLSWCPPTISHVHATVKALHDIFPLIACFHPDKWKSVQSYSRFGMPRQPNGSGSCGVGVILAAKDLCLSSNTVPKFLWSFSEITTHRKKLMLELISSASRS